MKYYPPFDLFLTCVSKIFWGWGQAARVSHFHPIYRKIGTSRYNYSSNDHAIRYLYLNSLLSFSELSLPGFQG